MNDDGCRIRKKVLQDALAWFGPHLQQTIVTLIESHFRNWPLPDEIQEAKRRTDQAMRLVANWPAEMVSVSEQLSRLERGEPAEMVSVRELLSRLEREEAGLLPLFKRMLLLYRRHRAAEIEALLAKTVHLRQIESFEVDVKDLDTLATDETFARIAPARLPQLRDFLPLKYIESAEANQVARPERQFDEKFHVLQAPQLFLPDVGFFRAKCEARGSALAVAFIDIDDFKALNTKHGETKVNRNVLPRFMQALEAHVYHHGYAYRQGGDEYLVLVPSVSKAIAIHFFDELRLSLSQLSYPDVGETTTVSVGMCHVEPDCPLTDRELLDRANRAKQYAKAKGKNRIATYNGLHFADEELAIAAPTSTPA